MNCIKCKWENPTCSTYCKSCGYEFSKKEQDAAKKRTLEGKFALFLEKRDKWMSRLNLSFITDHILFKIASVLLVLALGLSSFFTNGNHLKLETSDSYRIQYNTELNEYYLIVKNEETKLNLFVPNSKSKLSVTHYDKEENILSEETFEEGSNIRLKNNEKEDFYLLRAGEKEKEETLKIYIYKEKGDTENE